MILISAKATAETLTTEDWGAIMEVCDRVLGDPNGSKEVVQGLIKRLAHRNANVQLYTIEVRLPLAAVLFRARARSCRLRRSHQG